MKTRNREQKGSVERIGDYWCLRYADWRIENGERRRIQNLTHKLTAVLEEHKRLKRPPKYVEELQREFMERVNSSRSTPETCSTIGQFVDKAWLPFIEAHRASSTVTVYKYYWKHLLKPYVGNDLLRDFTTAQAEAVLNEIGRHNPTMRKATLHKLRSMLSAIFKRGIGLGYRTGANPCREITLPVGLPSEPTYAYTLAEIRQMLNLIQHESTRVIVALAGYAGLSRSEIQGLCWEAYDADSGEIAVLSSVVNGKRGATKTEARKNTVPLIQSVRRLLDRYRANLEKEADAKRARSEGTEGSGEKQRKPISGVMFATGVGTPLDLHNVFCDRIDPILNACEVCGELKAACPGKEHEPHEYRRRSHLVEWHGWHGFRRGLASNLYDLGVDDLTIQRILRHSDVETTRKSYIKVREPNVTAGMAQLEAEIRRTETVQ
jgi:integrase